jgi:flagellar biosynthetic protein FliR
MRPPPSGLAFAGLLLKELAVGTVLAVCAVAAFEAMRMAGQWIDDLRGASRTQSSLPHSGGSASALASLHLLLACLVFFELGGPGKLLVAVRDSLVCLPVDHWPDGGLVERAGQLALEATATAIQAGIQIAWPIAACVLGVDLVLGFINRAAPQMQVFFLGMPARAILGLGVAALGLERAATWFGLALPG